jgi:Tol biopolymer transport system component
MRGDNRSRRSWIKTPARLALLGSHCWIIGLAACGDGTGPGGPPSLNDKLLFAAGTGTAPDTAQIFVMNPDGSHVRQLTKGPGFRYRPVASPDGRNVAFTSRDGSGHTSIYMMDADGSHLAQLNSGLSDVSEAEWSPDGTRILFRGSETADTPADLYTSASDGSSLARLTLGDQVYEEWPTWSPDGARIAFIGLDSTLDRDVFLMNADGGHVVKLAAFPGEDQQPSWSPDGTRLAFSHESELGIRHIYVINSDGSGLTAVTSGDLRDFAPDWSPDGTRLVFGRLLLTPPERFQDVWLLNLSDLSVVRLTTTSNSAFTPSWTGLP